MIHVEYYDDVHLKVYAGDSTLRDMHEFFSFFAPGYKFSPKFRAKIWSGKIHLLNLNTHKIYVGLLSLIYKFAELYDETVECDARTLRAIHNPDTKIQEFVDSIDLYSSGNKIAFYSHQKEAIIDGIKSKRLTAVLPTSAGKSAIIYAWIKYYISTLINDKKILIIVPVTNLVEQLSSDFDDYYNDDFQDKYIHKIYAGKEKTTDKKVIISTWQSLYKEPKSFFDKFEVIICDEVHLAKANSIRSIMEKADGCAVKLGLTGTLEKTPTNKLQIQGLFGTVKKYITTKQLMDLGYIANLSIRNMIFKYNDEDCKKAKGYDYPDELKLIKTHKSRNKMVCKLAAMQKENCLILSVGVQHCKDLSKQIKSLVGSSRTVYCLTGATKVAERERVRKAIENEVGSVIVSNYGIFSTGVSIKNIHAMIFATPVKSMIRTLQSIGRGLRISELKWKVALYDVIDDLSYKNHKNYALKHYIERQGIYSEEKFEYSIHKINID